MNSEDIFMCKNCKIRPVYVLRSKSYCEHCLELRKKANLKYHNSHKQEEYQRTVNWMKRNPEKVRKYSKQYRVKHLDRIKEINSNYKKTEKYKLQQKEYRKDHKSVINLRSRAWQLENAERVKANKAAWLSKNPSKPIEYVHTRRSREQLAQGTFTAHEWELLQEQYGRKCLWCGIRPKKLSPDHVVPLSLGGTNYISNIQPLCPSCNSKKNTKIIDFRPFGNIIMDWT